MRNWRINSVSIIIIVFSAAIISRLIYIQILNHEYWQALAQGQQKFFVELQGDRGEVLFQDMTNLAVNQNFDLVYAVPNEIKNQEQASEMLSFTLDLDKNSILEKFQKDSLYVLLKKKLTPEEVNNIKDLNLSGIYLGQEKGRYYPVGELAAQAIGFLGGDGKGQYGIEGYYDDILQGKEDVKELEKGPGGYLVNLVENQVLADSDNLSAKGSDIVLTIDYNIQFMAEKLLVAAKKDLEFEKGEIIVMDPNSGKILALVNYPGFNPNEYSEVKDPDIFQDTSIQKIFEPGSIFKPITMAAALNEGKITPQTKFLDEGFVKIGPDTISNFANKVWGERTMTEVLEWSINTGAVFAEQQIGHDTFLDYLERFGFFDKTGVDLQGEISSQNQELKKGYEINFATASFGQGIAITSIQLVRAFTAIANGGKLMKPYIVDKIIAPEAIYRAEPAIGSGMLHISSGVPLAIGSGKMNETKPEIQNPSVISQKTASQVALMMVNTVENGYGKKAGVPGYYIAGKTGTAQIPEGGKYSSERTIQSFIGFGPALDPKFLIFVKLYNPKVSTAEYSAAPIFGDLAKYIINLWQIPPDHE